MGGKYYPPQVSWPSYLLCSGYIVHFVFGCLAKLLLSFLGAACNCVCAEDGVFLTTCGLSVGSRSFQLPLDALNFATAMFVERYEITVVTKHVVAAVVMVLESTYCTSFGLSCLLPLLLLLPTVTIAVTVTIVLLLQLYYCYHIVTSIEKVKPGRAGQHRNAKTNTARMMSSDPISLYCGNNNNSKDSSYNK